MRDEQQLLELCKYVVTHAEKKGVSDIEVLARYSSALNVDLELGEISSVNQNMGVQIAIRLYIEKRMGSAFTNIATNAACDDAVEMAIAAAKTVDPDPDWVALPEPGKYSEIKGAWQDSVLEIEPGKVVGFLAQLSKDLAQAEEGLIPAYGNWGTDFEYKAYANSNGIEIAERSTDSYAVAQAVAKTETGMTPGVFAYDVDRGTDIDSESVVKDISETIRICKTAVEGKTGKFQVLMHPFVYGQLMQYTLVESIKGDNVARGKSKIGDKMGEKIAPDFLSIYDDGRNPEFLNSSVFDDEGRPRQRTPIIENGILRSFLWDTYWANKMGVSSTGNASRNMRRGLVEISPSTIYIEPGKRSFEDIISGVDYGYYIRGVQGAHSSNPESGDFSVVGNPAILIEKGELKGTVHGLMVSGNIFDLLNQIIEIAKDPIPLIGLTAPQILFGDVSIISKD
ncbi:MAG: putative TldE/PmbA-like protein [Candidatus Thorarchaeota archaeon]|nr:MAG: putative TldE/PmbA-like protein [Candidatus Thorarchaeota archaeon]